MTNAKDSTVRHRRRSCSASHWSVPGGVEPRIVAPGRRQCRRRIVCQRPPQIAFPMSAVYARFGQRDAGLRRRFM